jgi:hypothetical protein
MHDDISGTALSIDSLLIADEKVASAAARLHNRCIPQLAWWLEGITTSLLS